MSSKRIIRINELLRREIGDYLFRLPDEPDFDISAVMITRVITSPDLRAARVLVSIRNHKEQREAMLDVLRRHRAEIQKQISSNIVLKYTPRLTFELDTSVEKGDHVLSLLSELDKEHPADPDSTSPDMNPAQEDPQVE